MLNGAAHRPSWASTLFALSILVSCALLYAQLAALYAPVTTTGLTTARLPAGFADTVLDIPAGIGFQRVIPRQGVLLLHGPWELLGQAGVSLCDQRASQAANATLLPLYVGWDWQRAQAAASANRTAEPPRPAHDGLKNLLLDDGPAGIDIPAFTVTTRPGGAPLRPYRDQEPLLVTVRDPRPVELLADTAASGAGPTLAFQRDLWMLWNANEPTNTATWDHAVRIRRLEQQHCPFGRLRISVYAATLDMALATEPRTALWYAGDGPARELRFKPGRYVASAAAPRREDAALFNQALSAGLLRPGSDGRIAVAPADLPLRYRYASEHPVLLTPPSTVQPDWLRGPWSDSVRALHRVLHFSAAGRYVRQQVEVFNSRQWLAAVRWRPVTPVAGAWRAEWGGAPVELTEDMPTLAGRLFAEIPRGWEPWQRVTHWPLFSGSASVRFRLTLQRPARRGERLEVLVAGAAPTVTGATVLAREPRCLKDWSCRDRDAVAHWLRLQWREGATYLTLDFQPLPATTFPDAYRYDFAHIQRSDQRLIWRDPSPASGALATPRASPAVVTLRDHAGQVLWENGQPTATAWTLGLAGLVGLDPAQQGAVADTLTRLGQQGMASADVRLTVDAKIQAAALGALRSRWPPSNARAARPREEQVASLVVLDADRGDILAVANRPEPPPDVRWSDLYDFAVTQPRRSPLRIWAWRHDGGGWHSAGSVFKLVDALLLEHEVRRRSALALLLNGVSEPEWAQLPLAQAYDFAADAACYPAHAEGCASWARLPGSRYDRPGRTVVHNVRNIGGAATLLEQMRRHNDERYGLAQALRDSLNTWFAWLVESTDATLLEDPTAPGLAGAQALTPAALHGARPLLDVAARLGFGAAQDLDGGLLPAGLVKPGDALHTTASILDPITNRAEIRLAALGFRMQVTPLQMASVAATIATGRRTPPRLLAELNGQWAPPPQGAALGIATDRIRRGMRLVVDAGTARTAFADSRFAWLRSHLYAKTGTADLDETGAVQNAWLVGWLEPGALHGEPRRLAFACRISHVGGTGGEECGPVVAAWLTAMAAAQRAP